MSFAEKLYDALAALRTSYPDGKIPKSQWLATTQAVFDREKPAKKKGAGLSSSPRLAEEEWLKELESNPALAGVDVRRELGRAQLWCKENSRKCSRKFFINWLLRTAERTVTVSGAGQSSRRPAVPLDPNAEPTGWQDAARKRFPGEAGESIARKTWAELDSYYRNEIRKELLK